VPSGSPNPKKFKARLNTYCGKEAGLRMADTAGFRLLAKALFSVFLSAVNQSRQARWDKIFLSGQCFLPLSVNEEKPCFWDRRTLHSTKAVCWRLHQPLTPLILPLTDLFKQGGSVKVRKSGWRKSFGQTKVNWFRLILLEKRWTGN
jgi:hypothetical protein